MHIVFVVIKIVQNFPLLHHDFLFISVLGSYYDQQQPPVLTKISGHLFRDIGLKGAVHVMYRAALKRQIAERDLSSDSEELFDTEDMDEMIDVLRTMQNAASKFWRKPKVYFDQSVTGERLYRLRKLVRLHGGSVSHQPEDCNLIVQYDEERDANEHRHHHSSTRQPYKVRH